MSGLQTLLNKQGKTKSQHGQEKVRRLFVFVKIFFKDAIKAEHWLQEETVYMKVTVNNIARVFSSPEAYADTNKSFKMYPPLHTVTSDCT